MVHAEGGSYCGKGAELMLALQAPRMHNHEVSQLNRAYSCLADDIGANGQAVR